MVIMIGGMFKRERMYRAEGAGGRKGKGEEDAQVKQYMSGHEPATVIRRCLSTLYGEHELIRPKRWVSRT